MNRGKTRLSATLLALVCMAFGCVQTRDVTKTSRSASVASRRSADVVPLRRVLAEGSSPDSLTNQFTIIETWHHDYGGPSSEVGGDAAPIMYFFFSDSGSIFRVHRDGRLIELEHPPVWLKQLANKTVER